MATIALNPPASPGLRAELEKEKSNFVFSILIP